MCGLIAAFNTKHPKNKKTEVDSVNKYIINQFEDQKNRGTEGFGIIRIDQKQKIEIDRATETTKFLLDLYMKESSMIIAHHRTPTSTENKIAQTHPIHVSNQMLTYDYLVIHNGIVYKDDILHTKHIDLGFDYTTEYGQYKSYYDKTITYKWNDSEALAIEFALFIEKKVNKIGSTSSAAIIILQLNKETKKTTKVFFGRNGSSSCLNMSKTRGKLRLSSEGEGNEIKENQLYSFKTNDPIMTLTSMPMPFEKEFVPEKVVTTNQTTSHQLALLSKQVTENKKQEETKLSNDTILTTTFIDDKYIDALTLEFKNAIDKKDAREISHQIDDALDSEMEKITDMITDYKEVLMTDKLEKGEMGGYMNQIRLHMKAMHQLTEIAADRYKTIEQNDPTTIEEMAEAEFIASGGYSDYDEYNRYDYPQSRNKTGFNTPTARYY